MTMDPLSMMVQLWATTQANTPALALYDLSCGFVRVQIIIIKSFVIFNADAMLRTTE